jgi:hypothetical protein
MEDRGRANGLNRLAKINVPIRKSGHRPADNPSELVESGPGADVTAAGRKCSRSWNWRRPAICIPFHICGQSRGSGRESDASAAHRVDCRFREKSHPDRQAP